MKDFKDITTEQLSLNPFKLKDQWMLITAQKEGKVNTMTASWGGFGVMWGKEVAFVVIRPQRYTKEFVDASESFSLSFFDERYKKDLAYLGRISGRDEDKITRASLTIATHNNVPYFKEAEMVLIAKKLYAQPMDKKYLLDENIDTKWYPTNDYHIMYIAEITDLFIK